MSRHNPKVSAAAGSRPANRRDFLQSAAGLAASAALASAAQPGDPAVTLPTIALGSHQVSRLIIGGNPIYGYSHFNRLLSQHQTDWHTPERVVELVRRCERAGINTWPH